MASILSVGTAVPPYLMPQDVARHLTGEHFRDQIANVDKYLTVFKSALVDQRHFCVEPEWFGRDHSLADKNRLYLDWAGRLCTEAIRTALDRAGLEAGDIDHFIFVSSSGIATPSLDVSIINTLGMKPTIRRLPLFGLGCGGGAAGLAMAGKLAGDDENATVLLVAVELNSLTFQRDDFAKSNLVAASLFGDGAAAVIVRGGAAGPINILKSTTLLRPGTHNLMGWDFVDTGFRVVFSRRVPDTIRAMMPESVANTLADEKIETGDVASFVFHPGGTRILEAYQDELDREPSDFRASYAVLSQFGNMSSATVLFVLDDEIRNAPHESGDYGLLAAFGPGFSAETTLLRWA
ncbi:type III polyketide synthase [Bauldia litoralis]|uniref:Alkylresorcinol/alkylpyrone synthase n=1 Tax=Bauldia litoralis TaxID=665467 RepID=A0A1G6EE74_9HYPH|nr:3-oxoacyl-[acyl-carrier-protein] synthase III C-terminal domain-containing protein [Bauldia litoralis]SDB55255.1 alkylresorcinol/alkylpyrone synthase [Bauldia litoralis]